MQKLFGIGLLLLTAIAPLWSQVYHDLGIGFSGLRIWEPSKPRALNEDLDYYWNPQVSYQLHFLEERLVTGLEFGWVYAKGLKDEENFFREDIQKSINLDIEAGVNLFNFKNSLLQWRAGVRLTRTYYFSNFMAAGEENNAATSSVEIARWREVKYDLTSVISYQLDLLDRRNKAATLALRISLESIYFFPGTRVFEPFPSKRRIAMGPSASLILRIKGKRNRGLF